jgi:hypothetical protein
MYDFEDIRALGRELDPGRPPQRLRQRILDGLSPVAVAPQPIRRQGSPRRWRLGLAAVGLAAAVAAGAVAVHTVGVGPAADLGPTAGHGHGPAGAVDAAALLSGAGRAVRAEAPRPVRADQFVYMESQTTATVRNEGTGAETVTSGRRQVWQSVDGTRDGMVRFTRSPDGQVQESRLPGCRAGQQTDAKGGVTVDQACTAHPAYRDDLPTDADAMLEYLYRAGAGTQNPRDQQAFTVGVDLVRDTALPPAIRAAVFDALAKIPSVTFAGDVVDPAGRPGLAVAITEVQQSRAELIFDKQKHTLLGVRETTVDGGRVLDAAALLKIVIVDRIGATG